DWPIGRIRTLVRIVSVVLVIALAWAAWRRPRDELAEAALWSLLILIPNFAANVAWHHYYTALTAAYVVILFRLLTSGLRSNLGLCLALAAAAIANWVYFASEVITGGMIIRQTGLLALSSLMLWVVLWAAARKWGSAPAP